MSTKSAVEHVEEFLVYAREKFRRAANEHDRFYYAGTVSATEIALYFIKTADGDRLRKEEAKWTQS